MRPKTVLASAGALLLAGAPSPSSADLYSLAPRSAVQGESNATELSTVLERGGRYVVDYERRLSSVAALETCTQRWRMTPGTVRTVEGPVPAGGIVDPCRRMSREDERSAFCWRITKADTLFARFDDDGRVRMFRDVFEANDKPVRDREPRLARLFSGQPGPAAGKQASALTEQSDTLYDIGPRLRELGVPLLALTFLRPENQARFSWTAGGTRRFGNVNALEVAFVEVARPTMIRRRDRDAKDGGELPVQGRVWIDPARGTVVGSELELRFGPPSAGARAVEDRQLQGPVAGGPRGARARISTEYGLDRGLSMWLPVKLHERYDDVTRSASALFRAPAEATTSFSDFRRVVRDPTLAADPSPARTPAGPTSVASVTTAQPRDNVQTQRTTTDPELRELGDLLRRAGEYVREYERGFSDLVAEESYVQRLTPRGQLDPGAQGVLVRRAIGSIFAKPGEAPAVDTEDGRPAWCEDCRQTTKADLVFVRLAGDIPWASYRDVFELNGRKLRDRDNALVRLLSSGGGDEAELSRRLLAASAEHNIGPVRRTVNLPTLPLVFLLFRNQGRFSFRLGAQRTFKSTNVIEIVFTETARPTLVTGPRGADLPASGTFWIQPLRGTVVRSEVEFDFGPESEARITAEYRPAPELALWVPEEMREHYADRPGAATETFPNAFDGIAEYSRFRRFTVASEGHAALPNRRD